MTTQDSEEVASAEEASPSPEPDGQEQAAPTPEESERERELQRRLTQQGREAAEARRAAAAAQQQASTLQSNLIELQSQVHLLTENLSEQQRQQAERQQRELDEYLKTLPPEQRLDRKIELLGEQIKQLQRPAATPSRPAPQRPPAPVQQPPDDRGTLDYMRRRAIEIVGEAESEFGVKVDVSAFPDSSWESEEAFYKAVMRTAARQSQNGGTMPKQSPANETPEQMQRRIRREVEESLGVSSPTSPRPAAKRGGKPTEEDVHGLVNGYQSAKGPRAAVAKLREMRERMG